jgi:AcrR family transcriptional regulator
LVAALAVLARDGYTGATTRAISREAGVALGLANYYFKSRRQLLAEVIASSRERFLGVLEARFPREPGPQTLRRALEMVRGLVELMPDWFRLTAELDAQGLRDPELRSAAAANKRKGERDVRQYMRLVCDAFGVAEPADLPGLSAALLAAFDGLAVRTMIDPEFDWTGAYRALERMIVAALDPAARPPTAAWDPNPYPELLARAGEERAR